jgi:hypothetical protein
VELVSALDGLFLGTSLSTSSGFRSVPSFLCGKFSFKFAAYNFPCVCDVTNYVGNFPPRVIFSCVSKISSVINNSSPQLRNKEWNSDKDSN